MSPIKQAIDANEPSTRVKNCNLVNEISLKKELVIDENGFKSFGNNKNQIFQFHFTKLLDHMKTIFLF